jgi:hypothetical protein
VLFIVAVVSVVTALAVVFAAVLRRDTAPENAPPEHASPPPTERLPVEPEATSVPTRAPAWTPVALPAEDTVPPDETNATTASTLKKCCDALRGAFKRTGGRINPADGCDRLAATLSTRSGPGTDALAAAALGAMREAASRETKGASLPAACR